MSPPFLPPGMNAKRKAPSLQGGCLLLPLYDVIWWQRCSSLVIPSGIIPGDDKSFAHLMLYGRQRAQLRSNFVVWYHSTKSHGPSSYLFFCWGLYY